MNIFLTSLWSSYWHQKLKKISFAPSLGQKLFQKNTNTVADQFS